MGRSASTDNTPILDAADQNIGNSTVLTPQEGSAGTVIPQSTGTSSYVRLLELTGASRLGQTVSVIFTATRLLRGSPNPNPGFAGPLTGILEYGSGGRDTRVEFDIPVGPFSGSINEASSAIQPQDGIVTVTVPTSVVRAYVRYDNLLLAPLLGTNPPVSHAQLSGVPVIGPGGPLLCANPVPPPTNITIPAEPVLVKAMASYFTKPKARVYKTLNCYLSDETTVPPPATIQVGTPSVSQIAGFPGYAFWTLPAFTKRIKVLRFPTSAAFTVLLHDGVRPVDFITVAGGTTAPEFNVVGNQNIIGISTGQGTVTLLKLVCEIGI